MRRDLKSLLRLQPRHGRLHHGDHEHEWTWRFEAADAILQLFRREIAAGAGAFQPSSAWQEPTPKRLTQTEPVNCALWLIIIHRQYPVTRDLV